VSDIKFKFSRRIPEEVALMEYLARFPKDRHAEQLRRLALKGFRQELGESGQSHRTVTEIAADPAAASQAEAPKHCADSVQDQQAGAGVPRPTAEQPNDLSLASLKNVVG